MKSINSLWIQFPGTIVLLAMKFGCQKEIESIDYSMIAKMVSASEVWNKMYVMDVIGWTKERFHKKEGYDVYAVLQLKVLSDKGKYIVREHEWFKSIFTDNTSSNLGTVQWQQNTES